MAVECFAVFRRERTADGAPVTAWVRGSGRLLNLAPHEWPAWQILSERAT